MAQACDAEGRIGAWAKGIRIRRSDQEKALKHIRQDVEGWRGLIHTHEAQVVLKRLDLAFDGFFRRVKAGQTPGFPRFRSADRFRGWGYKEHGNGFKVEMRNGGRHGFVKLFGIGRMRMRGIARTPGRVLKADVFYSARGWHLNVVVETGCAERARPTGGAIGLDWACPSLRQLPMKMDHSRRLQTRAIWMLTPTICGQSSAASQRQPAPARSLDVPLCDIARHWRVGTRKSQPAERTFCTKPQPLWLLATG